MHTPLSRHYGDAKAERFSLSQLLLVVIIGCAVSLLGFNYYHALNCPDNNPDATEASIEALSHRLAYSEALVKSNAATLGRLLKDMEEDLTVIGKEIRDKLHKQAVSEAVTIALRLSDLPVPPKPWDFEDEHGIVYENDEDDRRDDKDKEGWADDYETEQGFDDEKEGGGDKDNSKSKNKDKKKKKKKKEKKQYGRGHDDYVGGDNDQERGDGRVAGNYEQKPDSWSRGEEFGGVSSRNDDKQATFTDGISDKSKGRTRQRGSVGGEAGAEEGGADDYDDPGEEGSEGKEDVFRDNLSDADARHICAEWKKEHNVVVGVSWGSLPFQLQQKWLQYACDYLLS